MKKELKKYTVLITKTENDYIVEFPDLEGCFTQGKTLNQAYEKAYEVFIEFLMSLKENNEEIPNPTTKKQDIKLKENQWKYTIAIDFKKINLEIIEKELENLKKQNNQKQERL